MKHLNKLLLVFILLPFFSAAQANYQPGYVITLSGDTVRGFIDYEDWDSNPTAVSFKTAMADKEKKKFTLDDINLFTVSGIATYKKYSCSISTDITSTGKMVEGRDTGFKVATVFLKVLQEGKNLALYVYTDDIKERFYIGETPGFTPAELVYRRYYDLSGKQSGNTVNEVTYQKQLFAFANKYNALDDKMTRQLESSNYEKGDLLTIVSRINNISNIEFEKKYAEHGKFGFYVGASLNMSTTFSGPSSSYTLGGGISSNSSLPAANIGIDFIPDPNGRAELRVDLSFNPTQFDAKYPLKVSPYGGAKASYDQLGIFLTPQVLYNFYNTPAFKFYAGVGVALTYDTFSNPYFQNQDAAKPESGFPIESYFFNKMNNTVLLKAGFRIRHSWEIYFNYYTTMSSTKGGYFALDSYMKQVGVSYFLGK